MLIWFVIGSRGELCLLTDQTRAWPLAILYCSAQALVDRLQDKGGTANPVAGEVSGRLRGFAIGRDYT